MRSGGGRIFSESLGFFAEAAKLRPDDPEPHRGKAETYDLMGRGAEAAVERKQALRLSHGQ
jgi:Flp pilus assembly protein TadD